jgi:hypothetical protein
VSNGKPSAAAAIVAHRLCISRYFPIENETHVSAFAAANLTDKATAHRPIIGQMGRRFTVTPKKAQRLAAPDWDISGGG